MKDLSRANEAVDRITQVFKLQNDWRAQTVRHMNDLMTVIIAQRELINKLQRHCSITESDRSESLIQLAQKVSVMTEDSMEELRDEALDVLLQMSILGRE